ncbi:MAG: hypothetical protein Aureis2KO_09930 [Aureisphaera sp.]
MVFKIINSWSVKCLLLLVGFPIYQACVSYEGSDKEAQSILGQEHHEVQQVKLLKNTGIQFQYALQDSSKVGPLSYIGISCMVVNRTKADIWYLVDSCNGLEYFLESIPETYTPIPLMNCNASWPMISSLKMGDTLHFTSRLFLETGAPKLKNVGLDFRVVDRHIPFKILKEHPDLVKEVRSANTFPVDILWAE